MHFRHATAALVVAAALLAAPGAVASGAVASATPAPAQVRPVVPSLATSAAQTRNHNEGNVFDRTNSKRSKNDVRKLKRDDKMDAAAQKWAEKIAKGEFKHSTTEWRSDRMRSGWQWMGENIAAGQVNAKSVISDWMDSQGHRENILRAGYTHIGVGYYYRSKGKYHHYWVQIFAKY